MGKKLALLFFGRAYIYPYINFKDSYINYTKYIFDNFHALGYEIDVYFATNNNYMPENVKQDLIKSYKPKDYVFLNDDKCQHESRRKKINTCLDMLVKSGIEYTTVLITRFDLIFRDSFMNSNINYNMLNIVSVLEKDTVIDDNLYIFPFSKLDMFINVMKEKVRNSHFNGPFFIKHFGSYNIIKNEHKKVADLSFYHIKRHDEWTALNHDYHRRLLHTF